MEQMKPQLSGFWATKKALIIIAVTLVLLVLGGLAWWLFARPQADNQLANQNSEARTLFYTALGKAAAQQKIRVSMYRETFANKADADARQQVGDITSSVSEVDATNDTYRSVFAHNLIQEDRSFTIGRCMNGTTYLEVFKPPATNTTRATSLAGVAPQLKLIPEGNLAQVTQPLVFISCPHLGLLPGSSPVAEARLSDGVFPVTFSAAQAANWRQAMEEADLFSIQDAGTVEKDGKTLRKISFTPRQKTGVNKQLYNIFYQTGEIDKIKTEHPDAKWEYEFLAMNPLSTGSVGGFYLINNETNLPEYSELYSTNPDKTSGQSASASRNIARTKQTYQYPSAPTITLETPLEFLQ